MSYPKIGHLVRLLANSTQSGDVEWARTELSNAFQASFSEYSVRIIHVDPHRSDYLIQILDQFGDLVEEVSDDQLRSVLPNPTTTMKGIYDVARRKVMGVEDALDAILKQLGDDIPF